MMKKGIALIITVSVIAIISALILAMVTEFDKSMKQTSTLQSLNQKQLVIKKLYKSLKSLSSQITTPEALDALLLAPLSFSDETGEFSLDVSFSSLYAKLNINAMLEAKGSVKSRYSRFLYNLFNLKQLNDPDLMIALLADTIDSDTFDRYPESEVTRLESDFSNGAIFKYQTLNRLSRIYYKRTHDEQIQTIEWQDYFYLGERDDNQSLDCNYLSWEMLDILELKAEGTRGLDMPSCAKLARDQNETLSRYNIKPFSKGAPYWLHLKARYTIEGKKGGFEADYELQTQRIRHITSINSL